jgi:hypothetical protein
MMVEISPAELIKLLFMRVAFLGFITNLMIVRGIVRMIGVVFPWI